MSDDGGAGRNRNSWHILHRVHWRFREGVGALKASGPPSTPRPLLAQSLARRLEDGSAQKPAAKVDGAKVDGAKVDAAKVDAAKVDGAGDGTPVDTTEVDGAEVARADAVPVDAGVVDSSRAAGQAREAS